jgi:hypothetical protein
MRWRETFDRDQLAWAISRLRNDPNDRRAIIQMYHCDIDQLATDRGGKDIPCNIVCAPWVSSNKKLHMTIFCRSNDIIWGAYGANAVHFSVMQEYLAAGIGVELGQMYQVSNNYHMYLNTEVHISSFTGDRYERGQVASVPMFRDLDSNMRLFDEDLTLFFDAPAMVGLRSAFLRQIACPMVLAHKAWRKKDDKERFIKAREILAQCRASDWQLAGMEWMRRREDKVNEAG